MQKKHRNFIFVVFFIVLLINQSTMLAMSVEEAIEVIANRLENEQIKEGIDAGSWPEESNLTGSIVAGMARAFEMTCVGGYKSSAEFGGENIFQIARGNFYGDEAYALTCLDLNTTDPNNNLWKNAVTNFYDSVKNSVGSTENYILNFNTIDYSVAVLYLANHVVAAYYVDANDKETWRQGLIGFLSYVDDSSTYPVMAMGAATWALALTGPLDETIIHSSSGQGAPYWDSKKLSELPILLMSHQVQDGQPNAGSFYWQFGHTENSPNGYTEDAIFATLGLLAAYYTNSDPNLYSAIQSARTALLNGIGPEGKVWERLSQEGEDYYAYAGEMLQVLCALIIPGDINLDGSVDLIDFELFINNWGASDCCQHCWCNGADLNRNGKVDVEDLDIFISNWLQKKKELI
jgi:hypothetical protein